MCMEILLVCVGLTFMGMEILCGYYFHGYGIFFFFFFFFSVGHMFESILNGIYMEMRYFWVDWSIV